MNLEEAALLKVGVQVKVGVTIGVMIVEVELAVRLALVVAGHAAQPHLMDSARTWL